MMRLFISYARLDRSSCVQIVELLDMHEVWYDRRVHVGQKWWDEIVRRLDWCDGFIYLISKESLESEYCNRELSIALDMGKHIFPVMIRDRAPLPASLHHIQYIDMTSGLDMKATKSLLSALFMAERQGPPPRATSADAYKHAFSVENPSDLIEQAAVAMESANYDRTVFLLKRAKESGFKSRFLDLTAMIAEAEAALEEQTRRREAEREYGPIAALMRHERTRKLGCAAFLEFQKHFPDYDPENLCALCQPAPTFEEGFDVPLLEWCAVPAGRVVIEDGKDRQPNTVKPFQISKYPVTNAQYQLFIDATDGYVNGRWWRFSPDAMRWHKLNPLPITPKFSGDDHPRGNICWYEAVAFCNWLSYQTGLTIKLPTEAQWQRAAQGDDNLLYPWGGRFKKSVCNTRESGLRATTPVTEFPGSASAFGVCDLIGNVWEWCSDEQITGDGKAQRAVRGGSFMSTSSRSHNRFHFYLDPIYRYDSIGFRLVCE